MRLHRTGVRTLKSNICSRTSGVDNEHPFVVQLFAYNCSPYRSFPDHRPRRFSLTPMSFPPIADHDPHRGADDHRAGPDRAVRDLPTAPAGAVPAYGRRRVVAAGLLVGLLAICGVAAHDVLAGSGGVPASAAGAMPAPVRVVVVARPGDTLWSIAERFHGEIGVRPLPRGADQPQRRAIDPGRPSDHVAVVVRRERLHRAASTPPTRAFAHGYAGARVLPGLSG